MRWLRALHRMGSLSTHRGKNKKGRHFANDISCALYWENICILIQVWLKCVPMSPLNDLSALVWVMAWRRTGDKPLPEILITQVPDIYGSADLLVFNGSVKQNVGSVKHLPASVPLGILLANTVLVAVATAGHFYMESVSASSAMLMCSDIFLVEAKGVN